MEDGVSEIDDPKFFLAKDGKTNAKSELHATIDALLNEKVFDDNATACRFPARKTWLSEQLGITDFPKVNCTQYNKILKRLDPQSATLVFPAAHINSPASMFGHTFLRINSSYNSKLLSYAINYAADADADNTNGVVFAIKGLIGGYYGRYSLLPYYEKLREYRDTEQRDIWEYDLNLNQDEVHRMVEHIWELNGTHSYYYFFTENCSYNMLWFLEVARPSIDLRGSFKIAVIPLETVHVVKEAGLIESKSFRASKRSILLTYEKLLDKKYIHMPREIIEDGLELKTVLDDNTIPIQQKRYILESAIEYLEYSYSRSDTTKEQYVAMFYKLSKQRATLGIGAKVEVKVPTNPIKSHRAIRTKIGVGSRDGEAIGFLGIRPAYHDLEDSLYGFLRGTQIEFLNFEVSHSDSHTKVEDATILSIVSMAQRSEFFDLFSWRTKFSFDRDYLDDNTNFIATVGGGLSWGNELGYFYLMVDPLLYMENTLVSGVGGSFGFVIDKNRYMNTNFEITSRYYDTGREQTLYEISQNFRLSQNIQLQFKYNYIEKYISKAKEDEDTLRVNLNYYF
jgi:hypothetical protein